jgi:hypothetical protein
MVSESAKARGARGIVGMRSSHAAGGAGAVAESRKARFRGRVSGPGMRQNFFYF